MKNFEDTLVEIYGDKTPEIAQKLNIQLNKVISRNAGTPDKEWYRSLQFYCIYPDAVIYDPALNPLQNIKLHLKKVQSLGMNAVHILPFLASPMVDRGFDISDYLQVNPSFGNLDDIKAIMLEAKELGLHMFMDLVFNHVSDQHAWFKKAIAGDEYYRDFFIHTQDQPKFIRKLHKDSAVWAEYEVDGKIETVNIAFPEYAGPIPHWQQQEDGYWYYHTYYPSQIDLNWRNPDLFVSMAKIVLFWANLGFNFRLDAIPFVGKGPYKQVNVVNKEARAITAALKCIADEVNPNCAMLVETYEALDAVIEYFGRSGAASADLSYNFHLCTSTWVSLVTEQHRHIWDKLSKLKAIPAHGEWLNFLRNHDELSLAYLPQDTLKMMQEKLEKHGAPFREGYGISGRTFSLLSENVAHFIMAYFLLISLPGGLMLPYGDELGQANILLTQLDKKEQKDTRNINRGTLSSADYEQTDKAKIFALLSQLFSQRKLFRLYLNNWPEQVEAPEPVFACVYSNGQGYLKVYINLSDQPVQIYLEPQETKMIMQVNEVKLDRQHLHLGPFGGVWYVHQ